jgi:trans-2,3-dihydro-3-hydroxyanthranilate isomerase
MRTYRYLHLDVFTTTPFEGNQLAVFPEPAGLSDDEMQRITREMAFSECTYVFPPEAPGTNARLRIFTPGEELPMAGHPTIGSTFALAIEGTIPSGAPEFVFGLGVGPTPVALEWKGNALDFAWMTQPTPAFGSRIGDRASLASALGVKERDIASSAPQVVSCGVPFVFVLLTSRAAVDAVDVNRAGYRACLAGAGIEDMPVFLFTLDRAGAAGDETVYSRMLAPGFGIAEDPATGGASGPLGCYLAANQLLPDGKLRHFVSLQGAAMKRPSQLHVSIERSGSSITRVRVGGRTVMVGRGELLVP